MTEKQKAIVFASGTKDGGGSGFEKLHKFAAHEYSSASYTICKVVSNYANGGVREKAEKLGVPFEHFPAPWSAEQYRAIVEESGAAWVFLSGWLKFVVGLNPARTINIHPALLSFQKRWFGGKDLYGHHVHEAIARALENDELGPEPRSGFTMHFVVDGGGDPEKGYDRGPIFAEISTSIQKGMKAEQIAAAVNTLEHRWQPLLTDMVVSGKIRLEDGTVIVPPGYALAP